MPIMNLPLLCILVKAVAVGDTPESHLLEAARFGLTAKSVLSS